MSNTRNRYDEDFKKSIVTLYGNGRSISQLSSEYNISSSTLSKWIKNYTVVESDDGQMLTLQEIKELKKKNALLEEENIILKKAIAIFTPASNKD